MGKKDRITEIKEDEEKERETDAYTSGVGTVNVCGTHCHLLSAKRKTMYTVLTVKACMCVLE